MALAFGSRTGAETAGLLGKHGPLDPVAPKRLYSLPDGDMALPFPGFGTPNSPTQASPTPQEGDLRAFGGLGRLG